MNILKQLLGENSKEVDKAVKDALAAQKRMQEQKDKCAEYEKEIPPGTELEILGVGIILLEVRHMYLGGGFQYVFEYIRNKHGRLSSDFVSVKAIRDILHRRKEKSE